jgi:hypothetical protein
MNYAYTARTMVGLRFLRGLACLAVGTLLLGCSAMDASATAPIPPLAEAPVAATPDAGDSSALSTQYAQLGTTGGRVMRLQPQASQIRIHVFRAGRYARLGHNHVLSAPEFEGYVYWPAEGAAAARFDLAFRLDQLVFDLPEQRAALGPAFASTLSEAAIAATRTHMLGPDNMQAEQYPLVRIRSLDIAGEAPKLAARVAVDMHGQTRELQVPLNVTGLPQTVNASGALVLRQSDFGVQPYSVMGGLLAVQDDVVLEFTLVGE